MKEFVVFNDKMEKQSEEDSVAIACKKAYDIGGFVGVRSVRNGRFKEILQKNALKAFSHINISERKVI